MTLKQAWESWRMIPKNMTLATKSRAVFNDVLLSMYGSADLKEFTISFVRDIFYSNLADQGDKVKAASILVYLLEWGAEQGYCEPPSFDETIAELPSTSVLSEQEEEQQQEVPVASVPTSSKEKVKEEKPKKHVGRAMRKVVQLHPNTLEVIKTWDSMKEATVALRARNLDRAITKHFKAAGYYWCNPGEEESFKAARTRKTPSNKEHARNPLTLVPREETIATVPIPAALYKRLNRVGLIPNDVRDYNVGESDYSEHLIQPWSIWIDYQPNPFDADILKRILRHKKTEPRKQDYQKIIHICQECIRQIECEE